MKYIQVKCYIILHIVLPNLLQVKIFERVSYTLTEAQVCDTASKFDNRTARLVS